MLTADFQNVMAKVENGVAGDGEIESRPLSDFNKKIFRKLLYYFFAGKE